MVLARAQRILLYTSIAGLILFGPTIILSLWPISTSATRTSQVKVGPIQSIFSKRGYEIPNSANLNPEENQNFYLSIWFNPRELPREEMRFPIISKINSERRAQPGYAIALHRFSDEIRPEVYWRNDDGRGRWFTFAPFVVSPQGWHLLVLSFRENRYLGLHGVTVASDGTGSIQLLGGYEFEAPILLGASSEPLRVGTFSTDGFVGDIGPVGVILGGSSKIALWDIIESAAEEPMLAPSVFKKDAVKLWLGDKISSQYLFDPKGSAKKSND